MEKRVNILIEEYTGNLKKSIRDKVCEVISDEELASQLIEHVYGQKRLVLTSSDFLKRKRIKNAVPLCERCMAKRSDGDQCTRRKKSGSVYCGTHIKGIPHGSIENDSSGISIQTDKVEVWVQEIKGICYYLDSNNNVYQTEDIMGNKKNPKVFSKYIVVEGEYILVETMK